MFPLPYPVCRWYDEEEGTESLYEGRIFMYSIFSQHGNALERRFRGELLRIEPWGEKSFRVRATCLPQLQPDNWALDNQAPAQDAPVCIRMDEQTRTASITYGTLRAEIDPDGVLSF